MFDALAYTDRYKSIRRINNAKKETRRTSKNADKYTEKRKKTSCYVNLIQYGGLEGGHRNLEPSSFHLIARANCRTPFCFFCSTAMGLQLQKIPTQIKLVQR
ncbi:hypothetical protein GWI33_012535 [Rhynchophorus ferrugineus]|uniref:Uncharacterized protein n=1 Tax=Rhynchophorus ferrugineus TaxID=354439 RepID=A0A834IBF4_RHYFE|nr:hypothetical protein GWI33_012535 [Rhynchophorus ferrugineus]